MTVEKNIKEYETVYIAEDGTKWDRKKLCQQYEKLLKDPTPIKALKFFNSDGEPIDIFALGEIPEFCYLVIEENKIEAYNWLVVKTLIGNKDNDEISYDLPIYEGVYYNDWSKAYSGGYGRNGWQPQESIETLENRVQNYQKKLELLKKITKSLDK